MIFAKTNTTSFQKLHSSDIYTIHLGTLKVTLSHEPFGCHIAFDRSSTAIAPLQIFYECFLYKVCNKTRNARIKVPVKFRAEVLVFG